jgi:hypothetical protein
MEETTARSFGPRAVLAALGLAFVVAAVWAAAALASGGASSRSTGTSAPPAGGPPASFVQDSQGDAAPSREDCPGHGGGSGGDSTPSVGSGSSGNAL